MKHWLDHYSHFLIRRLKEGKQVPEGRNPLLFFLWEQSIPYQYSTAYTVMNLQLESSDGEFVEESLQTPTPLPTHAACIREEVISVQTVLESVRLEIRKLR